MSEKPPMLKPTVLVVLVVAFLGYTALVYTAGTSPPAAGFNDIVRQGKRLWNANNCVACHQLYGLGGFMGPDLTNVISTKGEAYARAFIVAGTQKMPRFDFTESDVQALLSFLSYVDGSGASPPTAFDSTWFGTVLRYEKERDRDSSPQREP